MSLQELPTEILLIILEFVGRCACRTTKARSLTVCKWWHRLAEPIFLEDITVSASRLSKLSSASQTKIRLFTQRLAVNVGDTSPSPVHAKGQHPHGRHLRLKRSQEKRLVLHLERLNLLLRNCSSLESFSLGCFPDLSDSLLGSWSPSRLLDSLWSSKISRLEMDTGGVDFGTETGHLCPQLALQIPSLRFVRLRMRSICPDILRLQHAGTFGPSRIEELIINLSLADLNQYSISLSAHCSGHSPGLDLAEDMIVAGKAAVRDTPSLKTLKIVGYIFPSGQAVTHDCVADITKILSEDLDSDSDCNWACEDYKG
ncbi:uncharacterized protein N7459_003625 [Penicillium hispanicum]|uniref:uncharacterized protein n=1 Tax=Penicillium hispanicum TaxID=1080232 RepID=UPI00253F83E5|nr:uncharacterized protein N7459_003625 [Penicillium hispanicum]KAJ5587860.1 hypothetical protein N7459_003625 [Penicillium hispanicum]